MERLYKKLSDKHDIPVYALKILLEAPFRLMSEEMENRTLKSFNLPHLGKVVISPGKKKWVIENILEDKLKEDLEKKNNESGKRNNTRLEESGI